MKNPKSQILNPKEISVSTINHFKPKLWLLAIICNLALGIWNFAPCYGAIAAKKSIKEANTLYQKGKLDEALQKYNEASVAIPDSDIVNFNMGAVLYKKADYQKAQEAFTKALTSNDKKVEADALYNLGNCKYKLGKLKENTDLSATVVLLRESLDYYKRAVEIDQKNTDARFNHEFVERELKVLLDKLKQQKPNADKQKNQQEKQQGQQTQGASGAGIESSGDKKAQGEKEESSQAQEEQQQKKDKEGEEIKSSQEESQGQREERQAAQEELQQEAQNKELSEAGARTLLERYGREEAIPNYMDRQTQGDYDNQVSKDW